MAPPARASLQPGRVVADAKEDDEYRLTSGFIVASTGRVVADAKEGIYKVH